MAADEWRNCVDWLVRCQILPADHKATRPEATAFDLAQALRDGVLICHLVMSLRPGCIDMKDFSSRPQMSQFLCMKNIRTFLHTCTSVFGLDQSNLFKPNDLFDVKDFGKVLDTLSRLSKTDVAQFKYRGFQNVCGGFDEGDGGARGRRKSSHASYYNELDEEGFIQVGFPPESGNDSRVDDHEDIYGNLQDLALENDLEDQDDIYDTVYQPEEKIYDDLLHLPRPNRASTTSTGSEPLSKRDYCIKELLETESNYKQALDMIKTHFIVPLKDVLSAVDMDIVFAFIPELLEVHIDLYDKLYQAVNHGHPRLADVFVQSKSKMLIYGDFCSNLPKAQETIDRVCETEMVRLKVQECECQANKGKFRLRDLLHVPMQRVLKYHLLMRELIKNTDKASADRDSLERALEAMQDLSLYVNEVKRDHEGLQVIQEIQNSISDLRMPPDTSLKDYGRFQKDGELKVLSHSDSRHRNRNDSRGSEKRHIFLFDKVMLMCKAKGDTYSYKDAIVLGEFHIDESSQQENKKAEKSMQRGWNYPFIMVRKDRSTAFSFFAKTAEQRDKWREAITLALDNSQPAAARNFVMHTFDKARECDVCGKLLRGVFYQGYLCTDSKKAVHKECIGKPFMSGPPPRPPKSTDKTNTVILKAEAVEAYRGAPAPPSTYRPALLFNKEDVMEVIGKPSDSWWKGRFRGEEGYFPPRFVVEKRVTPRTTSYEDAKPNLSTSTTASANGLSSTSTNNTTVNHYNNSGSIRNTASAANNNNLTSNNYTSFQDGCGGAAAAGGAGAGSASNSLKRPGAGGGAAGGGGGENNPNPSKMWYVGEMERNMAQKVLDPLPDGTFLIRVTTNPMRTGELSLSIKHANAVRHIKVNRGSEGGFYLAEPRYFDTVHDLVSFYQQTELADSFPEVCTTLKHPYKTVAAGIMCYAVAVFDYAATSTSQVTLQVNDRIAVLSKAGQDRGWWKGENIRTQRIGYFPLAYVKDDDEGSAGFVMA